ncbi:CotH protein [Sphingobacterium nematocida]|uniref:CotH protein n=1 Tax=Sphingobacterium nematocida TaxID=1513896 RepID=A0A1T5DKD9_9SPHI|nr:CotH kinase family protein [Sphingobacterium nematocida]SKB72051.1 CotH protein [Sphingobacterium nematocida]
MVNGVQQQSGISVNDFVNEVSYTFIGKNGNKKDVKVKIVWTTAEVPHIQITTAGGEAISSRENYLQATVSIDGKGRYLDFSGSTEVKGRGNSTWAYPKKPYRLKLNSKSEILGMGSAKNWVLLANYLDPSLMSNAVAMKIGQDLEVPFTNTIIPVDLTVNGVYKGSYVLTQQIEVQDNRVNIGKDGYLLELDTYFDETYKFYSTGYSLPVMIKEPELEGSSEITPLKTQFDTFEALIKGASFPNNNYGDYFDKDVFARYILVYFLAGNEEINHPKSVYMHKKAGGKFTFGPLWDFDWAYGYEGSGIHFTNPNRPLFWSGTNKGTVFLKRLFEDPEVQVAFKKHWTNYKERHMSQLIHYIDAYASLIKTSKSRDYAVWGRGKDFEAEVGKLKKYIQDRALYIDRFVQF